MGLSIGNIIGLMFVLILIGLFLSPAFMDFTTSSFASNFNNSIYKINSSVKTNFYNPISTAAFSNSSGFNAQILSFTGLAFVFYGISTVISSLMNVPTLISMVFSTALSTLSIPLIVGAVIAGLFTLFIFTFIIFRGIGWWMKYDTWS